MTGPGSVVPNKAVEAAAKAEFEHDSETVPWENAGELMREDYRNGVRVVLAVVVPYIEAGLLRAIAEDEDMLEVARLAVEDELVEWRDERRSMPLRNNGLTIRERDGSESGVIRFGPETAVRIGLRAIAAARGTQEATK